MMTGTGAVSMNGAAIGSGNATGAASSIRRVTGAGVSVITKVGSGAGIGSGSGCGTKAAGTGGDSLRMTLGDKTGGAIALGDAIGAVATDELIDGGTDGTG